MPESGLPYTIVRATQFHEFAEAITGSLSVGDEVQAPDALIQPIASDDVAAEVARVAVAPARNGHVNIGGPDKISFGDLARAVLRVQGDDRPVVVDPHATYFGTPVNDRSLVTGGDAVIARNSIHRLVGKAMTAMEMAEPRKRSEQSHRRNVSPSGCSYATSRCRANCSTRRWHWRCARRRTPTFSRGGCFSPTGPRRDRLVEALLRAGLRRVAGDDGAAGELRARCARSWARWCTDRWAWRGTTRRRGGSPSCATGSSSARPWPGVVCMHRDLGLVDSLGVGMFLQTLVLALTERGLGTCVQVSIAHYPEVLREQLDIPDDLPCPVRPGDRLPRSGLSGQPPARCPAIRSRQNVVFLDG